MSTVSDKPKELTDIHDFGAKLLQPELIDRLKAYVRWQVAVRQSANPESMVEQGPPDAPVSINLDLTTACNYACDHCVDMNILNTGIKFNVNDLKSSLDTLWKRGLKSVIIIGGGEPTVDPNFCDVVRFLKERGIHVAIVTNGSGMHKILEVAHLFGPKDWVRLSLDSGSDPTFQAMHKPKKPISLEQICQGVPPVRQKNPILRVGFSFIVTWKGAFTNDMNIVENIHEMRQAAELARAHDFTYISFKPFLERTGENAAEKVGLDAGATAYDAVIHRIRRNLEEMKDLETDTFKIVVSTNLRAMGTEAFRDYTRQPVNCHFTWFRQILSPLGIYNCPVYRHVPKAKLGDKHDYRDEASCRKTQAGTLQQLMTFNAEQECKQVTCLYNPGNWFIEDLIRHPEKLDTLQPLGNREDYFL